MKLLFIKFSTTFTVTQEDREVLRDFRITAFDTTCGFYASLEPGSGGEELARRVVRQVDELPASVERKLKEILQDGEQGEKWQRPCVPNRLSPLKVVCKLVYA